jgi:hypothetical protein
VFRSFVRLAYAARTSKVIAAHPYEGVERTVERVGEWRGRNRGPAHYDVTEECEERAHRLIGARWPCDERHAFEEVWQAALDDLAARGLDVGRGAFGGWDDGDARLGGVAWCLARHLRPERVVETGVARGLTTRVLLEALHRNGSGRLWSIDLPPLTIPERRPEIAVAVPASLRDRWTYIEGSSRRKLPGLLRELGELQLFLHDSWHSRRNTQWELTQAWPALSDGGVVVADDIDGNWGFAEFEGSVADGVAIHCIADDGQRLFGVARKAPANRSM